MHIYGFESSNDVFSAIFGFSEKYHFCALNGTFVARGACLSSHGTAAQTLSIIILTRRALLVELKE